MTPGFVTSIKDNRPILSVPQAMIAVVAELDDDDNLPYQFREKTFH